MTYLKIMTYKDQERMVRNEKRKKEDYNSQIRACINRLIKNFTIAKHIIEKLNNDTNI